MSSIEWECLTPNYALFFQLIGKCKDINISYFITKHKIYNDKFMVKYSSHVEPLFFFKLKDAIYWCEDHFNDFIK